MYANAAGIVPVVEVFVAKGIPLGTAIAFMMAVVGLFSPEATLLKSHDLASHWHFLRYRCRLYCPVGVFVQWLL